VRVQLAAVSKRHGAQLVLDQVELTIGPHARVGVVGPNGVGKTTLLRILAGVEEPDAGSVVRAPDWLSTGYLAQERLSGDAPLLETLARRTGVAQAELDLLAASSALASDPAAAERYSVALERFVALGGGDFDARARAVCAELGFPADLERPAESLSGGERARAALAAILLSRFDVLLLDEPTNDLDVDGLERLERFLTGYAGALVVVSHDRELLDRTVTRIVEIVPDTRRVREWAGSWSDFADMRETERLAAVARYEEAQARRRKVADLLAKRRTEARGHGDSLGKATGGADRRATQALRTKVRQAAKQLERAELPEKPFEHWELRLTLEAGERPGDLVARLDGAVAVRGAFTLGPVSLDLAPGERVAVTGRNGSGKSTLLGLLLGEVPLEAGERTIGRRTRIGALLQRRDAYAGEETTLLAAFRARTGLAAEPARTLLAKFGLGADHVGRSCASLSPGERTRAQLAELQSLRVNLLVLDEPTNHLDIEAVEQLESALSGYDGTLVVVSHDRRFLERLGPTRALHLNGGSQVV
jgi:ATPase subunit of ABC transporter with duplicated ATPase domains